MEATDNFEKKITAGIIMVVVAVILFVILIYANFFIQMGSQEEQCDFSSAEAYLDVQLDEDYVIKDAVDTDSNHEKVYVVYLPESDITVHAAYKKSTEEYIGNHNYYYQLDDYYEVKFNSLADERERLRAEKYPDLTETTEYSTNMSISCVRITAPDLIEYSEELYNYLIDVYHLNDFRYYNEYSSSEKAANDFITIMLEDDDEWTWFGYFSDLREDPNSDVDALLSYDEFMERLKSKSRH